MLCEAGDLICTTETWLCLPPRGFSLKTYLWEAPLHPKTPLRKIRALLRNTEVRKRILAARPGRRTAQKGTGGKKGITCNQILETP